MEFFAGLTFLSPTPDSPFFMQKELPSDLCLEVGAVLERSEDSKGFTNNRVCWIGQRSSQGWDRLTVAELSRETDIYCLRRHPA